MLVSLGLLLALDAAFVLVHVAHVLTEVRRIESPFGDYRFSLEQDGGYAEWFEYAKAALCSIALAGCWAVTRQPIYAALVAVFGLVLADNALMLHETLGSNLSGAFEATEAVFASAPQAVGEFAAAVMLGTLALALLLLGYWRSAERHRMLGLAFILLLLALGAFGAVVDLAHAAAYAELRWRIGKIFGLIEDGGEFVVLSLACALALAAYLCFAAERRAARTTTAAAPAGLDIQSRVARGGMHSPARPGPRPKTSG